MVQNILNIVHREIRGLHQAAYILALFTFGSQLLALVRDRLLAHQFGAHVELDLYYAAFRIPDTLYVLFASTLSIYVLIPFIAKRMSDNGDASARKLLSELFSLFFIVYSAIAFIAIIFSPAIVAYAFPGFVSHSDTLVPLMRILLIQPLLLGISSIFGVITQMERRFILYAISPLLYNVGIIVGLLFLYPYVGVNGLAYGVVLGALGHVCVQLPSVIRSTLRPRLTFSFSWSEIIAVCKTSFTRALTLSLHQIVLLGFVGFASVMTVGSVSVFQFAYNLQSVPLAIIGVSYSVAAFPLLAQLFAEKKYELMACNITSTLKHIFFWSLPAVALFVVVRAQFVRVVLGTGEFDWNDTRLTAAVLALFILSLTAQAVHLLIVRALYAAGNTRIPFLITLFSSTLALMLAYFFHGALMEHGAFYSFVESSMRLEGVLGIEVLALPLGYSVALILHSVILFLCSRRTLFLKVRTLILSFIQSLAAAIFGGGIAYTVLNYVATLYKPETAFGVFTHGLTAGACGFLTYIFAQYIFQNTELREILITLRKRFSKEDVMVAQDEDTLAV